MSSRTVIYVVKRRWHVDIGFAATDLQPPLASLRADFPEAEYLLFGFGDRHYLLDQDRGPGGMLAALWPGPGLMLVTSLTTSPQTAFGKHNVIEISVNPGQARNAQDFVWQSLAVEKGSVTPLHVGPYDGSLYYAASQRYSAWHTCNTWAAQALQAADVAVRSLGVELSGQLWMQVRRIGARQDTGQAGTSQSPSHASPPPP